MAATRSCFTRLSLPCKFFSHQVNCSRMLETARIREARGVVFKRFSTIMIVGLGKSDAPDVRCSVGVRVVDKVARKLDIEWTINDECEAFIAAARVGENDVVLLKSMKDGTRVGVSVYRAANLFNVKFNRILVVQDSIKEKVGRFRYRAGGVSQGHKMLQSIIDVFGSTAIKRLCLGTKGSQFYHMLDGFYGEEEPIVEELANEFSDELVIAVHNGRFPVSWKRKRTGM